MLEEALRRAIQEAPEDDLPRLAYADFLEEQGGAALLARAEFIRVQCELARGAEGPREAELEDRERALWKKHGKVWCAPLKPFSNKFEFKRGFPDQVLVHGEKFLAHSEEVLSAAPVFSIRLRKAKEQILEIAKSGSLRRLSSLSLYWNQIGMRRAVQFAESPNLAQLVELDLDDNKILPAGLKAILGANLPRLNSLNLRCNQIGDEGARLLAEAPLLGQIRTLILSHNQIGDAGVRALAASAFCSGLTALSLCSNDDLGNASAEALARSPHLARLASLSLSRVSGSGGLTAAGARALASAPFAAALTHLHIPGHSSLGDTGVVALAESPRLEDLVSLDLTRCGLGADALVALSRAPFLEKLGTLRLGDNPLSAAGVQALCASGRLKRLRVLKLAGCDLPEEAAEALAGCPELAGLRELVLANNRVGDRGAAALASSPHLGGLRELNLWGNRITDAGALALAASPHLNRLSKLGITYALTRAGLEALEERFGRGVLDVGH